MTRSLNYAAEYSVRIFRALELKPKLELLLSEDSGGGQYRN